ncbi:MAG: histidinol phosphate phosphatase domain-containing protein [Nitrospinota bacterium]|nr:histidinol phosphate phosphatase domain-containing protein [Nitrospinota bacterium]MDH5756436.1 histidinol phosphate phosphatase domain-containing protein [Nitrospinota bacterium]
MIDLHMHTFLSDGVLVPSELTRRAAMKGYRAMAITDHVDMANAEEVIGQIVRFCSTYTGPVKVIPGAEITHVPPQMYSEVARICRKAGARALVAHGETIVEPVEPGTNRAAIEAGVDVLAHPGLISEEDARMAAKLGVALEISGRGGHSLANGHVAAMARKTGARLVFDTDTHAPHDLMDLETARKVAKGAGMAEAEIDSMFQFANELVEKWIEG